MALVKNAARNGTVCYHQYSKKILILLLPLSPTLYWYWLVELDWSSDNLRALLVQPLAVSETRLMGQSLEDFGEVWVRYQNSGILCTVLCMFSRRTPCLLFAVEIRFSCRLYRVQETCFSAWVWVYSGLALARNPLQFDRSSQIKVEIGTRQLNSIYRRQARHI